MFLSSKATAKPIATPFTAAEFLRTLAAVATGLLFAVAVFVIWRRLAGGMVAPPPAAAMLLAAALIAGLGWTARFELPSHRVSARRCLVSAAIVVLGMSLSRADGNVAALVAFWTILLTGEVAAWRDALPKGTAHPRRQPIPLSESSLSEEPLEPAADVLQQLTRRTTAEGREELSGWLRMNLAPGQRTGTLHVAFCPPFDQAPEIEVEAVSGPDCRIKPAPPMPYGVRLDIKLASPATEGDTVLLSFFAAVLTQEK